MATSITHEDVKPRLAILVANTTYDDEIDLICTPIMNAVDAAVGAVFLAANAALVKEAAINIAAGTCWLRFCHLPGYTEGVVIVGLTVGPLDKAGAIDLIKIGWDMLKIGISGAQVANATDLPQETHDNITAATFLIDSVEYYNGPGS